MNIKIFFILFLLNISLSLQAQKQEFQAPDYALIKKNIEDKTSEFYYPRLLKRLKANDTLLTNNDYRHLYFGFTFQKNYKPYKIGKKSDELKKFYLGEGITEKDFPKGIQVFEEELEDNPFNLRAMNYLAYLYHLNKNEATAKKMSRNFHGLLDAILSSGDGLKCETGFHVIAVPDEYVILNMFQMETRSQSYSGKCDYIEFEKDKYRVPGLYFDVSIFYGKF
ncbi:DUF4919 domain-containing protein [Chryseobacterium sp. S-02]|uniref:DUF4919 domain-containing protein n=1 Tax=Chryseobacterium sp. S-02 TaxID=3404064 RepID=UPI003CE78EF7